MRLYALATALSCLAVTARGGAPTMWLQPVIDMDPLAVRIVQR
jgi:hypothetical protein